MPRCSSTTTAHAAANTLFVVAAHIRSLENCEILNRTITSIECFAHGSQVLIVDNDSPMGNVERAVGAPRPRTTIVRPDGRSRFQLGAWAAAWRWLADQSSSSSSSSSSLFERYVLLQHSTVLVKPLPPPRPGCDATSLDDMLPFTGTVYKAMHGVGGASKQPSNAWKFNDMNMRWASDVARAVGIACLPPCVASPPCRNWNYSKPAGAGAASTPFTLAADDVSTRHGAATAECVAWGTNRHGVLSLTRRGWDALVAFRLWPQGEQRPAVSALASTLWAADDDGHERQPHSTTAEPSQAAAANSSRKEHFLRGSVALVGIERLSGILLAAINEKARGQHGSSRAVFGPADAEAVNVPSEANCTLRGYLLKIHGRSHRNGTASETTCGSHSRVAEVEVAAD